MRNFSRNFSFSRIFTTSLAIFAMLFGAGNLMLPLKVGMLSGQNNFSGLMGFTATGVLLPLLGLLSIISFQGDYRAFFGRIGRLPGLILTFLCMMIIGPLIVMPRIVTLSYEMLQPFLPAMPVGVFAALFLALAFGATYKPSRLLTIIGRILSPLKITSLLIIILAGLIKKTSGAAVSLTASQALTKGIEYGYQTLDLLGAIFFGSIIVSLLQQDTQKVEASTFKETILTAGASSVIAALLLGLVYAGMSYLGVFYGHGLDALNEGQLFSAISFRILATYGAALIGFTVFLACFTTTVALTAVVGEYVHNDILQKKISYPLTILTLLGVCMIPSCFGLAAILSTSKPFIFALYPVIVAVAVCNSLYKLFGFRWIKVPVGLTVAGVLAAQFLF